MTEATYTVQGMTCGHCVSAVREEIGKLDGVREVDVNLETGKVRVLSDGPLPTDRVREAVDEAGYELVDA
ncbi:MAG TPA: copper ion binding protein [Pseudonocardiaceae bacterium]